MNLGSGEAAGPMRQAGPAAVSWCAAGPSVCRLPVEPPRNGAGQPRDGISMGSAGVARFKPFGVTIGK